MSDWAWTFDDDPSDLSVPGANFDKRLLAYAEDTGEISVDIAPTEEVDYFFSGANQPSSNAWRAGELWRLGIDITQADSRVSLQVALARVDGFGVFQEAYAVGQTFGLGSVGPLFFSGNTLAQNNPQAGDRLRVLFKWTRALEPPATITIKFGFGDPSSDFVEVPIEMGNSVLVWNGNSLNFPNPLTDYRAKMRSRRGIAMSDGKVHETSLRTLFREIHAVLANFDDAEFEASLHAWWAWAVSGKQYAFAYDSADQIDTTLDGAAASGQKVIPLTDTAGIVVGKKYLTRQAAGNKYEIVHVESISAGVSVTARDNLKSAYVSGDIFRSRHYFPKVISPAGDEPWFENPGLTFTLDHLMREDAG